LELLGVSPKPVKLLVMAETLSEESDGQQELRLLAVAEFQRETYNFNFLNHTVNLNYI
jgi:hypothetical protein